MKMGNKDLRRKSRSRKRRFHGNRFTTGLLEQEALSEESNVQQQQPSRTDLGHQQIAGHDDDVNYDLARSAKKIKYSKEEGLQQNLNLEDSDKYFLLIDFSVLKEIVSVYGFCQDCHGKIEMLEDLDKRKGFCSSLLIICSTCKKEKSVFTSKQVNREKKGPKPFEVNTRMVLAFREIGRGYNALNTFTRCMNMNRPMTQKNYDNITKSLHESYLKVSEISKKKAAKELFEKLGKDTSTEAECDVSVDGTWQKRGHASLNGAVTVISKDTGKCLDSHIMSKSCKGCQHWRGKEGTVEHQQWSIEHNCQINHKSSSGSMETAGAIEIFKRSVPFHNLKYVGYIGDGDTQAYQSVVDAKPYGSDVSIRKYECVGHVQKRMGTRLRNLRKDMKGKKLSDGKMLSGKGRLTDKVINVLQNCYGMAIRQNKGKLYAMKKSVAAILFHYSENPDEEDKHKYCPKDMNSWCKYQADKLTQKNTYRAKITLPSAVAQLLKPIFQNLSSDELLEKCTHGRTQNENEALNGIIWQRCPKTVYVSRNILELATASAVISFNDGACGLLPVLTELGIEPGSKMSQASRNADAARIKNIQHKSSEKQKKRRRQLRGIKKGFIDREQELEGETYQSGAF